MNSIVQARRLRLRFASKMPERSDNTVAVSNPSPGRSSSEGTPERRIHNRAPFTAAAEVYDLRSQTRVAGRCSDISPGGCYVDSLTPLAVKAPVRIRIVREFREFEAQAVVAYAHIGMGMGLTFTEISDDQLEILLSWISEASGGQPDERPQARPESESSQLDRNTSLRMALTELITLLVHKKVLSEEEAAELLRQTFR